MTVPYRLVIVGDNSKAKAVEQILKRVFDQAGTSPAAADPPRGSRREMSVLPPPPTWQVHAVLNNWNPDSEVERAVDQATNDMNRGAVISRELYQWLRQAGDYCEVKRARANGRRRQHAAPADSVPYADNWRPVRPHHRPLGAGLAQRPGEAGPAAQRQRNRAPGIRPWVPAQRPPPS